MVSNLDQKIILKKWIINKRKCRNIVKMFIKGWKYYIIERKLQYLIFINLNILEWIKKSLIINFRLLIIKLILVNLNNWIIRIFLGFKWKDCSFKLRI